MRNTIEYSNCFLKSVKIDGKYVPDEKMQPYQNKWHHISWLSDNEFIKFIIMNDNEIVPNDYWAQIEEKAKKEKAERKGFTRCGRRSGRS